MKAWCCSLTELVFVGSQITRFREPALLAFAASSFCSNPIDF